MTDADRASAGSGPVVVASPLVTLGRALPSLLAVGVAGLLPLWGAVSLDWSVLAIALAYVAEAAVVGFLGRYRARHARGEGARPDDAKLVSEFFKTYMTVVVAAALICGMVFGGNLLKPKGGLPEGVADALLTWRFWAVVAGMAVLQLAAHWWDYVHCGERELLPPEGFVGEPLRRLFILQVTVLALGLLVYWRGWQGWDRAIMVFVTAAASVLMAALARLRVARNRAAMAAGLPPESLGRRDRRRAPRGGRKRR